MRVWRLEAPCDNAVMLSGERFRPLYRSLIGCNHDRLEGGLQFAVLIAIEARNDHHRRELIQFGGARIFWLNGHLQAGSGHTIISPSRRHDVLSNPMYQVDRCRLIANSDVGGSLP